MAKRTLNRAGNGRVLVTGSHGFIGTVFATLLGSRGISFLRYERGVTDLDAEVFDRVVHFAGITPPSAPDNAGYKVYHEANVVFTRELLDALKRKRGLMRFVNIGSASEYGPARTIIREGAPERPTSDYGCSKLEQTRLIEQFAHESGVSTVNLRVFNVAGLRTRRAPGTRIARPTVFDSIIEQLEVGNEVSITNRNIRRDFVDVDDIAVAALQAVTLPHLAGYQLVNIATGKGTKLGDIAGIVGEQLGKAPKIKDIRRGFDSSVGDPAKAMRLLKWSPKVPLEESVRRMLGKRVRVLLVGAGVAGQSIAKELTREGRSGIVLVGLVDDDRSKRRLVVEGRPVLGSISELPQLVRRHAVDQVLLSTPSVGSELAVRVAELLPPGFPIRVLPSATSVLLGRPELSQLRSIDPSDLVGRPLIKIDQMQVVRRGKNKTFLVSGGAGSIGSEIVRQLCATQARRVVVFDAWEEGVFNLLEELKPIAKRRRAPELVALMGNVRDRERLAEVVGKYRPDVIIHAAAYKHVPLMQDNPREAYKTNVRGTRNLLDCAVKFDVPDFILISTDKAVRPANIMGRTKRSAELLVKKYARQHPKRRFIAVRFGNVLNSSGSVIPTFLRQIRNRQPVTVTHPDMTRYFMSVPEAVSLVLQSWLIGSNGQVLLLDMGNPVRILDLALQLIRIHGLEPYKDIEIKFVGIRPGEKLHEELAYDGMLKKSPLPRIFIAEEA